MLEGLSQSVMLIFTLFSDKSLHSSLCEGLCSQAGLHTGSEHLEHGNTGGLTGARHVGHTGHVTRLGPDRAGLSSKMVSRALMARVAIRPRPRPSMFSTLNGKHFVLGR